MLQFDLVIWDFNMITAEKLKILCSFDAINLTHLIQISGYKKDKFRSAKFLGLTNGNQFCYEVGYIDTHGDGSLEKTKVFLDYNFDLDQVSASY